MKLNTSLDWADVKTQLKNMSKMLPEFSNDFYKIIINLESLVRELGNIEIEARCRRTASVITHQTSKISEINDELRKIEKIHLVSLLRK